MNLKDLTIKNKKIDMYFCLLIVALLVTSVVVFKDFILLRKTYLFMNGDVGSDTFISYWPAYDFFNSAFANRNFSLWSFEAGLGTNIFSILPYITDIFSLPLIFISRSAIPYALGYITIFKIILAGIFMYRYMVYMRLHPLSAMIVSLLYAYSGYMIMWGQHYFFATIVTLFPLLLLCCERWISEKKWLGYVLMIGLISTNFYFFFQISIFLLFYIIIRYIMLHDVELKQMILFAIKTFLYTLLGFATFAAASLSYIYTLIVSPRVQGGIADSASLLYPNLKDLFAYALRLVSNGLVMDIDLYANKFYDFYQAPNIFLGILPIVCIPFVISYIRSIEDKKLRICNWFIVAGTLAVILLPFFKYMFNSFSAQNFRWHYLLVVTILYLLGNTLNHVIKGGSTPKVIHSAICMFGLVVFITGCSYLFKIGITNFWVIARSVAIACGFSIAYLVIFSMRKELFGGKIRSFAILALTAVICIEVGMNAYDVVNDKRITATDIEAKRQDASYKAIKKIQQNDKDSFYRIDKKSNSITLNDSLIQDFYGVKSYISIQQPGYLQFIQDMQLPLEKNWVNFNRGFYNVPSIYAITGVKYYVGNTNDIAGFENSKIDKNVFINKNALPLGFTYDKYIQYDEFLRLIKSQKERQILESVVVENPGDMQGYSVSQVMAKSANEKFAASDIKINPTGVSYKNINMVENKFPSYMEYTTTNEDPQMFIPIKSDSYEGNGYNLTLEIESQSNTFGVIYCSGKSVSSFEISKGRKLYNIYFETDAAINTIRLDLGNEPNRLFKVSNVSLKNSFVDMRDLEPVMTTKNLDMIQQSKSSGLNVRYKPANEDPQLLFSIPEKDRANKKIWVNFSIDAERKTGVTVFWNKNQGKKAIAVSPEIKNYSVLVEGDGISDIRLDYGKPGEEAAISNIQMKYRKMDGYFDNIQNLRQDVLKIESFKEDRISGNIQVATDKLLFLSIPYDKGWQAEVDGKQVQILKANIGFMAIPLKQGMHTVTLRYTSPLFVVGCVLSAAGVVIITFCLVFSYIRFRRNKQQHAKPVE